ncbi:MAG: efflux RND transporter periplasmic adaptor subunit [Halioglobus sp.]|nr:efflux RND transporter periplasmic adaptor subunit [Halioglobus sp.]
MQMITNQQFPAHAAIWLPLAAMLLCAPATAASAAVEHRHAAAPAAERQQREPDTHGAPHAPEEGGHREAYATITLSADLARQVELEIRTAGPGHIERHISVYGRLVTPPDQVVQSRARFPGVIRDIEVNVGDEVSRDQVLAVIESNASLRGYELRAPIDGVIQERMANVGEITGNTPLFTLVNNDTLWARLKVFPSQRFEVQPGQDVHVSHNGHLHDSHIASVTPGTRGQPYVVARVVLTNSRGDMAPGDMVSAQVDAEKAAVALAVASRAVQTLEEQPVVFVQEGDRYAARTVSLGRTDGRFTEVRSGLEAGERYVADNSYLLKAELLKAGAAHEH